MILAALGTAALFTACGDDSSSSASDDPMSGKSVVSCDMVTTFGGVESHTCMAIAADNAAAEAKYARAESERKAISSVFMSGRESLRGILSRRPYS